LEGHDQAVFALAWAPDSRTIASGSGDNGIRIWNRDDGKRLAGHYGHHAGINDLAWSPDGRRLVSASYDQWTRAWNITGSQFGWEQLAWQEHGHSEFVCSLAWSADGKTLASSSNDTSIIVRDAESGRQLRVIEDHSAAVTSLAFSSDGRFLASKSQDKTVRIRRCDTWDTVAILAEPHAPLLADSCPPPHDRAPPCLDGCALPHRVLFPASGCQRADSASSWRSFFCQFPISVFHFPVSIHISTPQRDLWTTPFARG